MFRINGVTMLTPNSFEVTLVDFDGEGTNRDLAGFLHRDRIRSNARKINVSYTYLLKTEAETITHAISPSAFTVEFYDAFNGWTSATMYAGDRKNKMLRLKDGSPVWDLSFSLTEY